MNGDLRFSVNPLIHDKPPTWRDDFAENWQPASGSLADLLDLIGRGIAFIPAAMDSPKRTSDAFISADLAVVDVDHGLSLDDFGQHPLARVACALYTTASHSDEPGKHRFRVIFALPERITDPELYKTVITLLIQKLGGDKNCSDPCRLFYGCSTGRIQPLSTEACLDQSVVEEARQLAAELKRRFETAAEDIDELDLLQAGYVLDQVIPPTVDGERDRFVRVTAAAASAGVQLYSAWSEWASRGHHGKGKNARQVSERYFRGFSGRSSLATLFYFAKEADPDWRKSLPEELRKPYEGDSSSPGYGHGDFMGDEDDLLEIDPTPRRAMPAFNSDPRDWGDFHRGGADSEPPPHPETQGETEPSAKRATRALTEDDLKVPVVVAQHFLNGLYPDLRLNRLTLDVEYGPADQPKVAEDLATAYVTISRLSRQNLPKTVVYDTALVIAESRSYNPVTAYLEHCSKTARPVDYFERIATELLGVPPEGDDNPRMPDGRLYADVVLERFLLGAVARAIEPGCSMPWMPVLQGSQNVGKTNFLAYLTPLDPLSNTHCWCPTIQASLSTLRERPHILHAGWIVLLDEAERYFQRRYVEELKNLISVSSDKSSPKYQEQKTFHRSFVLAAATNSPNFLVDPTGNRRFMPIRVLGKVPAREDSSIRIVDLDRVKLDRNGIWAAAYQAYQRYLDNPGDPSRKPWEFSSYELSHLQGYSESFMVDQPLTGALQQVLDKGCSFLYEGQQAWTTSWICEQLELRVDSGMATAKSISNEMSRLGYVNLQRRVAGRSKRFWLKELTPEQRMKRDLARQLGLG
jgi:hypothetical protein